MYICKETFFEDSKYNDQFKLLKQTLNFNFKIGTNTTCTLYMLLAMGAHHGGVPMCYFCHGCFSGGGGWGGCPCGQALIQYYLVPLALNRTLTAFNWFLNKLASAGCVPLNSLSSHPSEGERCWQPGIHNYIQHQGKVGLGYLFCPWVGGVCACWFVCLCGSLSGCSSLFRITAEGGESR
jgi:hypothetical protein